MLSCSVRVGGEVEEGQLDWSGGRLTCPAGWVGLDWIGLAAKHTAVAWWGFIARDAATASTLLFLFVLADFFFSSSLHFD